jgi:D-alanyl-D-alanine carboxypeptidase/D-alanyl-D-alanine-endopeptidase (penicillin-binding protein 4)
LKPEDLYLMIVLVKLTKNFPSLQSLNCMTAKCLLFSSIINSDFLYMKTPSRHLSYLLFCTLVFLNPDAYAQKPRSAGLQEYLDQVDTSAIFRTLNWGCILENARGELIAGVNHHKGFIPASTLKIAVTYPAYCLLKPEFRFSTVIEYDGTIKDSILHGNLYIRGGGDPTLGSWRFKETGSDSIVSKVYQMLKRAGINSIEGGLIADAGYFEDQLVPDGWIWEDIGNYYGAGVSGLNYHENLVEVTFQPGKAVGEPAKVVRFDPIIDDLTYENEVMTGKENTGDQVIIYGAPYDHHRVFSGTVPLSPEEFTVKGSLPDPAVTLGKQIYKYMIINNINIKFGTTSVRELENRGNRISQKRLRLGVVESPLLMDIIRLTHEKSVNIYADAMLKMIGKIRKGEGSYRAGIESVKEFWKSKGINTVSMNLEDGCGLSPLNRLSPENLSGMMKVIAGDDDAAEFINTLNAAGESGDLKDLFRDGICLKKLRGKSGYMKTVRAYTGIILNGTQEKLSFSILVNHYGDNNAGIRSQVKQIIEKFCAYQE